MSKLCFIFNHMCMDGGGLKMFLSDLFRSYSEYTEKGTVPLTYKQGSRSYKRVYDDMSEADRKEAKKQFANVSVKDKHSLPFSEKQASDRKMIVRKSIDADAFRSARKKAKLLNATVNDVVAAAYIRAVYGITGCARDEKMAVSCAVDLRRYMKNAEKTGYTNHTAFMPITVDGKGSTMEDTVEAVAKSTKKSKSDRFMGLHGLPLLDIGYSTMVFAQAELVVGALYNNANLAMSNVGDLDPYMLAMNDRVPVGAAVAGAAKEKPCSMMTALSYNGKLMLTVCVNGNNEDKKLLQSFLDEIEKNIKAF